jgi:hypothetical protein
MHDESFLGKPGDPVPEVADPGALPVAGTGPFSCPT